LWLKELRYGEIMLKCALKIGLFIQRECNARTELTCAVCKRGVCFSHAVHHRGGFTVCYACLKKDFDALNQAEDDLPDDMRRAYPNLAFWKRQAAYVHYRKQFYVCGYPLRFAGGQYEAYYDSRWFRSVPEHRTTTLDDGD
jgi:hypothetical protein